MARLKMPKVEADRGQEPEELDSESANVVNTATAMLESGESDPDDDDEFEEDEFDDEELSDTTDLEARLDAHYAKADEGETGEAIAPADDNVTPTLMEVPEIADSDVPVVEQANDNIGTAAFESSTSFERYRARRQWEENCQAAKEKLVAAVLSHAELKAAAKSAKEDADDALESLADLLGQNPDYPPDSSPMNTRPVASSYDGAAAMATPSSPADSPASDNSTTTATAESSTTWRSAPLSDLGDSLTPKLIERLQEDGITTIGQLEDRRGQISEGKAKWPKGIGEVKITAIEDAIVDWLTKNRDKGVFEDLASGKGQDQGQDDGQSDSQLPAPEQTSDEYTSAINSRAIEIEESDSLDEQLKAGYWDRGFEHYKAGAELATCGLPASPAQDDFIRGWLAAGRTDELATSSGELDGEAESTPPIPAPELVDFDNI